MTLKQEENVKATIFPTVEIPMAELVQDVYASASPPVNRYFIPGRSSITCREPQNGQQD